MENQLKYYQSKLSFEMDSADLYLAINKGENVIAIDARSEEAYQNQHIPTALNLPHRIMNESTTKGLDSSITYVCYCDGIGCNASTKGALKLLELGFKVKELIGGIEWWKFDGHATEGLNPTEGEKIKCSC